MRFARRRDFSEKAIVEALESRGCLVVRGQDSDLYVKIVRNRLGCPKCWEPSQKNEFLVECKTPGPNEKRRQKIQQQLKEVFGPQYVVAKTPEEALKALGLV